MMKTILSCTSLLWIGTVLAQAPPARPTQPVISPDIQSDRSVIFRLSAPQARGVALRGQWQREAIPMTQKTPGNWEATTAPVPPGVWEYGFVVDGLEMIDPRNPALKPQRQPTRSILHIPDTPPQPWDFQDVPHGTVHHHAFHSKSLRRLREFWVYTPPGYETTPAAKYPLLVLQHGSGDNHKTWIEHGKAHWILDRLIANGQAVPMIVVMLDGHPRGMVPRENAGGRANSLEAFQKELFEDALPLVESSYRVAPGRENRGIVGLSMGGWQAITVGMNALDRFAWIGSFSGAAEESAIQQPLSQATETNAKLKLLWIACGKNDFLLARNQALVEALKKHGIQHEWILTEGDHSWPVWRRYLTQFAPRVFR